MARMGVGVQVKSRLYLEGMHVDALLNVQVSGSVGGPATAQISLTPTNTAKHLMPGTWVHVFATDPWDPEPQGDMSDYKLLFEGVVVGRGFTREQGGRSLMLQCADPSIYWVNARQFWMNLSQSGGGLVNQFTMATSGGYGVFGSFTDQPASGYFLSKLALTDQNSEERLLDTMISLLDDVGNVNPFYNNVRNRFRITDRILKTTAGKTEQLFQLSAMTDFLNGLAGRSSGQTNLAQMVNLLLAPIYHEWVSVVAPSYVEDASVFSRDSYGNIRKIPVKETRNVVALGTSDGGFTTGETTAEETDATSFEKATDNVLGSVIFKPQVYTISPPTCNVLFPNMYDHQSYSENFLVETTRVSMSPQFPFDGDRELYSSLLLMRPVELEVFRAVIREDQSRKEDAKFGDGEGQNARLHDFDWTTNEERIRGISYNFMNLPPAASTLTLTDQGRSAPEGTGGGVLQYLQNVTSYEYYKSKFQSRASSFTGPFNMRPVPGFSMLALDDSDANMNIVSYLASITHSIDAKGLAQTTYEVKYPRVIGEVDWNRPIFEDPKDERTDTKRIAEDDAGNFRFERLFDGQNRPAIPEWFGDDWRFVGGLNDTYKRFFGETQFSGDGKKRPVTCIDQVMFTEDSKTILSRLRSAKYAPSEDILKHVEAVLEKTEFDAEVGEIDLQEVVTILNQRYDLARTQNREFEMTSRFTARPFAKIDQAFRFIGAKPAEISLDDAVNRQNAGDREYNYAEAHFEHFVGDSGEGSGYSGVPKKKGESPAGSPRIGQMSGAFPLFDTRNHDDVTADLKVAESKPNSGAPRYDGRPVMFDFERRMWEESKNQAGVGKTIFSDEQLADDGFFYNPDLGTTESEQIDDFVAAKVALTAEVKDVKNHTPEEQAPTGASLNSASKLPLPEPLSENQVVELRRRVVKAYRDELKERRGFTG